MKAPLLVLLIVIGLLSRIPTIYAGVSGVITPCGGCPFGTPFATLTPLNAQTIVSASYSNHVLTFNVTGDEVAQGFYQFYMNSYGNGSLSIQFIGIFPGTVQLGTVLQTASYAAGIETLFDSGQKAASNICVIYTGGCGPSPTGGGGGSGSGGGIPGVVNTAFKNIGGVNTGIAILLGFIGFILAIGLIASRRRDKPQ